MNIAMSIARSIARNIASRWNKAALLGVCLLTVYLFGGYQHALAQNQEQVQQKPDAAQSSASQPNIDWGTWGEWHPPASAANPGNGKPEQADSAQSDESQQDGTQQPASQQWGVGIQGTIENQLSELDKSSLLNNANGVAVQQQSGNNGAPTTPKPTKDIKRMMQALQQMEAEVEKEINNDAEF